MKVKKRIKKRYLLTVTSILLAIFSILLLRFFDTNIDKRKITVEKELKAIMDFNRDFFIKAVQENDSGQKAKILRDQFANKISYKKLYDKEEDFKNFKYLPDKDIYGIELLNKAHVGFFYNSDDCGKMHENKSYCGGIIVDINGNNPPNRYGNDQFLFKIYKDGIIE